MIEQVLQGMAHIHRQKIVHRNLCPSNILIYPGSVFKVSDFSNACRLIDGTARGFKGVVNYMAPEVICQYNDGRGRDVRYNHTTDIWAVGCILMETAQGIAPFLGMSVEEIRLQIISRRYRPPRINAIIHNYSNIMYEFANNAVEVKPLDRWTAPQLLAHPWIVRYNRMTRKSAKEIMRLLTGKDIPVADEVTSEYMPSEPSPRPPEGQVVKCKYDWSWITKC